MLNLTFHSIGAQSGLDGKLSSHRSDYEIHSPEHRSIPKRPQSTAELVSVIFCFRTTTKNETFHLQTVRKKYLNKT